MAGPAYHERLTLYAVDALSRRDRRAVERHLAECSQCRTRLVELGESGVALERESDALEPGAIDPPRDLLVKILEQACRSAAENTAANGAENYRYGSAPVPMARKPRRDVLSAWRTWNSTGSTRWTGQHMPSPRSR